MYPMRRIPLETKLESSDVFGWKEVKAFKFFFRCQRIIGSLAISRVLLKVRTLLYVFYLQ